MITVSEQLFFHSFPSTKQEKEERRRDADHEALNGEAQFEERLAVEFTVRQDHKQQ